MRYVKYVRADGVTLGLFDYPNYCAPAPRSGDTVVTGGATYHVRHIEWHPADRRIRVIVWHNDTDELPTEWVDAP